MNREIHKASAVVDILYIFIWIPDVKLLLPDKKLHISFFGRSNCCLNFIWQVQLLPALLCVESGTLFTPVYIATKRLVYFS